MAFLEIGTVSESEKDIKKSEQQDDVKSVKSEDESVELTEKELEAVAGAGEGGDGKN